MIIGQYFMSLRSFIDHSQLLLTVIYQEKKKKVLLIIFHVYWCSGILLKKLYEDYFSKLRTTIIINNENQIIDFSELHSSVRALHKEAAILQAIAKSFPLSADWINKMLNKPNAGDLNTLHTLFFCALALWSADLWRTPFIPFAPPLHDPKAPRMNNPR